MLVIFLPAFITKYMNVKKKKYLLLFSLSAYVSTVVCNACFNTGCLYNACLFLIIYLPLIFALLLFI